jgi:uncharacterized protein (DUF305 family)
MGGMMMDNDDMMKMGTSTNSTSTMSMGSMSMDDMTAAMQGKTGKDLEKAFITGMIPHHAGAVAMAQLLLKDPNVSPQLKTFAENIIKAQNAEIVQMNAWLKSY